MFADRKLSHPTAQALGLQPHHHHRILRNAAFLKTVGATHVLDRNLSQDTLQAEIRKITDKPITTIYDAAGTPETQVLGYDLLASGGTLASVQPSPIPPEKLVPDKKAFFMFGDLGLPQNRKLGASLYSKLTELLAEGALKVRFGLCWASRLRRIARAR